MTEASGQQPPQSDAIPIGVFGRGRRLDTVLRALAECDGLSAVGIAGLPQQSAPDAIPWYDDSRVLLTESGVKGVVLADSPELNVQRAADAAELGVAVWRMPPVGREFAEAGEVLSACRRETIPYRVASWWEFVAETVWADLNWDDEFRPRYSELLVSTVDPAADGWEISRNEAGGGVLMLDAYDLLEALIAVRGLPDTVVATADSYRTTAAGTPRETEDTALAILHYADGGTTLVQTTWGLHPFQRKLAHHSTTRSLILGADDLTLLDREGRVLEQHPFPRSFLKYELDRFADSVRTTAHDRAAAPLERHLQVSALLETVYLAARTGHPESPRKRYEAHGWPEPH